MDVHYGGKVSKHSTWVWKGQCQRVLDECCLVLDMICLKVRVVKPQSSVWHFWKVVEGFKRLFLVGGL